MSLATIELNNMEFYAYHGCYDLEQQVGNRFRVDMSLQADVSKATASDNVNDTINYLDVFRVVEAQMQQKSRILEHVAGRILDAVYANFPQCRFVTVRVAKLAPPLGGKIEEVAVSLCRGESAKKC